MIERIIRAKRKFVLGSSSESHVFEKGEVHKMKFGSEVEFDNLLACGNFDVSNQEELDKALSGTLPPVVETPSVVPTEPKVVSAETNVDVPIKQQDNTKPESVSGKEIDLNKFGASLLDLYADGKTPSDKDIELIENLITEIASDKKKMLIELVEKSDMSEEGKKNIIALLKKRTMSKCSICGKRKKKEAPFCDVHMKLKTDTVGFGADLDLT